MTYNQVMLALLVATVAAPFVLVDEGRARADIVIPQRASAGIVFAASELRDHVEQMTGAKLEIRRDGTQAEPAELLIGPTNRPESRSIDGLVAGLPAEGYVIRQVGDKLVLHGPEPRGSLYAAYGLLEDHLGVRWYTKDVAHVPSVRSVRLTNLDDVQRPQFEYREPYEYEAFFGDWPARNRTLMAIGPALGRHGGQRPFSKTLIGHTYYKLVPPDRYFRRHPEYFAEVRGRRLGSGGQICTTHPDVVRIVTEGVREAMREEPAARYFSVSQNDFGNPCECRRCRELTEREGTLAAPVVELANRVARTLADEFPGKKIVTLAYLYSRRAPRTLVAEPNVVVQLCPDDVCLVHPFASCASPASRRFMQDLREWGDHAPNLWVWNYTNSATHFLVPFPNLHVRGPNLRTFAEHRVSGVKEAGVYATPVGEFNELSAYLGAKLLWNPYAEPEPIIQEFLDAVYGGAAGPLREWHRLLQERVEQGLFHLGFVAAPGDPYLNDEVLRQGSALFDEAEARVSLEPERLERVRQVRLSLEYALIERERVRPGPEFGARVRRFEEVARRAGVKALGEGNGTLDTYLASLRPLVGETGASNLALGRPVTLTRAPNDRYSKRDADALTDGRLGSLDLRDGAWLGWNGLSMQASVNLGRRVRVGQVTLRFLESTANGVFLPARVRVQTSQSGRSWATVGTRSYELPEGRVESRVREETFEFRPREARYVRVIAEPVKDAPRWFRVNGGPVWLFCDEIQIV